MTETLLKISDLNVQFGDTPVLQGVNLMVQRGEAVGITGQNGSGKSTLLKTVCRKIRENSGSIIFAGQDLKSIEPHRLVQSWQTANGRVGISTLWQSSLVFPSLTVEEHLLLALTPSVKNEKQAALAAIYAEFQPRNLEGLRKRLGGNLSGGQRQLLSLAILWAHGNPLWLLDEPFAGLDVATADFTTDWLKQKNQAGITMLVVAHEWERVQALCPIVWRMVEGQLERVV
jgi:ABC-type multidrug transport system ATPase subunit